MLTRLLWAVACGVVAWLICVFLGGFLALTHQVMLAYLGHFLVTWAILIGVLVAVFAFVAGAPARFGALFNRGV